MIEFGADIWIVAEQTDSPFSNWAGLRVEERPFFVASPEINEDDHACDGCVRTP